MSRFEYLISLANKTDEIDWKRPFLEVLGAQSAKEIHGNPRLERVSFVRGRAAMRLENSLRIGLKTFGLESLISALDRIPADQELETYSIETSLYRGSCFVFEGRVIGCEFVRRGMSKTAPFNG